MNISILSVGKAGPRLTSILIVLAIIGAVSAAETYLHGGSTATIQQSGGSGKSESKVIRYKDGQKIITQNENSTDITIQREDGFPPFYIDGEHPDTDVDYFYHRFIKR